MARQRVRVIGGGLAGPEAALIAASRGCDVDLYEMRPVRQTPAHQTSDFGELVCSNSLKSESEHTAPWLLKQEMRRAGSPLLQCADASAVPAGHALAVDRVEFSRLIAETLEREPRITIHREEVTSLLDYDGITIVASGAGLELYLPLVTGAKLICAATTDTSDPSKLCALIRQHGVTLMQATPATWRLLLEQEWSGFAQPVKVLCGGEALPANLAQALLRRVATIWNLYGPTETTIWSTVQKITGMHDVGLIGRPIANTRIYILDPHGEPVPVGVVGELYIGGVGVARGYLNRAELTSERFVADRFAGDARARIYKTGDLARYQANGDIEFLGRNDHQVKLRGYRIELGEIEAQLARHPLVKEAVVLAREGATYTSHGRGREAEPWPDGERVIRAQPAARQASHGEGHEAETWADGERAGHAQPNVPGEKRLVAYVTLRDLSGAETQLAAEALRAHLTQVLPEHMLPSAFVVLEQFPLTPNGKLDRHALPMPGQEAYASRQYEAPHGQIEVALAGIWQELLGVERVGRQDGFFDLGGHSLLALQLLARVRETLGRELALRTVFEHPTLQGLAAQLNTAELIHLGKMEPADRSQPLLLSWSQQRLWFIQQLEQAGAAYHISAEVRLRGELAVDALQAALDALVMRHEVLRTVFESEGATVRQKIAAQGHFALRQIDLTGEPSEREAQIPEHSLQEARAEFDLRRGPLVRGRLLRVSGQEHVLLVTMHHIVSDAWSIGIAIRELGALYTAFRQGQPDPLPPLKLQYADYAQWQRQWLTQERLGEQLEYWRKHLQGAPELLELPTDRARPSVQSYRGASVDFCLGADLSADLKAWSQRCNATLYMSLHAAFSILLSRLSGQEDLVIGVPVANRSRTEVEGLIGFFVNTLALRVRVEQTSVRELLQQVKEAVLDGYAHQEVPFEQVVEALQPVRSLSHSPVFQVMLVLQNAPRGELQLPGVTLVPQDGTSDVAQFDLSLSLQESGEDIVGSFNYASDLFDRETIERWVGYFKTILTQMVREAQQKLGELSILPQGERQQLLQEFNATQVDYARATLIHELFEEQAGRTPGAVAVVYGEQSLTYDELNSRANQLARGLRERGVGPDCLVGLCLERSVDMVVAVLGVLKAGGAYVPLDPAYPAERLAYMLGDSQPVVVLTQQRLHERLAFLRDSGVAVLELDGATRPWEALSADNLMAADLALTSQHLAYVIYTSGSTGKPKGVMVEHRGVCNFLATLGERPGINSQDVLLAVTSLSFDIAGLELYLPLVTGAKLICAATTDTSDPSKLCALIRQHGVTLMQATPATWRLLLEQEWSGFAQPVKVLCGGEALPANLAQALLHRVATIWNLYGPTETTIWSTVQKITGMHDVGSIGRPIANTRIYILDPHGEPVPVGVVGELYISGVGVARGYLNRAELTSERFVADRFAGDARARIYKTGDLARYRADGDIEFLGRNDGQVKVRGFRIELGEIEARLAACAGVREAVVVARNDGGERRLAAYVTTQASDPPTRQLDFSLFYFGAEYNAENPYRLYLEAARYADSQGFEAIWTPERHFHDVGSLYPNPAVLSAALATVTTRIQLRSGSVVLPLHHPVRVAEEWSVVDNLSGGRVGVSVASGWHPRDFVLAPERYGERKAHMARGIEMLRALWRGDKLSLPDGAGKLSEIRLHPKPVQEQLPLWVTSAGNPETFAQAGAIGANVLTHLLDQRVADVKANIARYRQARAQHGHDPQTGRVTLMVHSYLGDDLQDALGRAKEPFKRYMRSHIGLAKAWVDNVKEMLPPGMAEEQSLENIVEFAFERYSRTAALIGTPESCLPLALQLREADVDEVACLIDWMDAEDALAGLPKLTQLHESVRKSGPSVRSLRNQLMAALPEYMVPANITVMTQMPLTPNGKLDRRALPAPQTEAFASQEYEAPQGEVEKSLARICRKLLQIERIGRHDNFFELGGHSLLAVSLIEHMRREGLHADLRTLFATPTLKALAESVRTQSDLTEVPPNLIEAGSTHISPAMLPLVDLTQEEIDAIVGRVAGGAANIQDIYPLVPLQEGILFHHLAATQGDPYLQQVLLGFDSRVRLDAWLQALQKVVARHDILRTAIMWEGLREPVQVVSRTAAVHVEEIDVSGAQDVVQELEARVDPRRYRMDVRQAPLMRVYIAPDERNHRWVMKLFNHQLTIEHTTQEFAVQEVQAHLAGMADQLPKPEPFRNFVVQARLGMKQEEHEAFFREMLSDVEEPTAPYGLVDVQGEGIGLEESHLRLDLELARRIREGAQKLGASAASLHHLAWAQVISRLSGREDVVFGTVLFGRMQAGEVLGLFINTLPIRLDLTGLNVRAGVQLAQRSLALLMRHEHASLALAQRSSAVPSGIPLFSTLLNFRHSPDADSPARSWEGVQQISYEERTNYPITLNVDDLGEGFSLNAQVQRPADAARVCEYMRKALEQLVAALEQEPQTLLSSLDILPAGERQQLLVDWNATAEYPSRLCLHELFEEQVARTPGAVAVMYGDQSLTYAELNTKSNQLARYLRERGTGPDQLVGICVERSLEMVVGLLGILKAGGAYVPLDPSYPAERLHYMLDDAAPRVLLTQARLKDSLPPNDAEVIALDEQWGEIAQQPGSNLESQALGLRSDHLAYVIYTSGSTGQPKGVMVEHAGLSNYLHWALRTYAPEAGEATPVSSPLAFDATVTSLYSPLLSGRAVILIPSGQELEGLEHLLQQPRHLGLVKISPAHLQVLGQRLQAVKPPCTVGAFVIGGEALPASTVELWRSIWPQTRLINEYGPTETVVGCCVYEVPREWIGASPVPIGRPISNTQMYLLDGQRQPVPIGALGEIYIGGAGVARGYLNRAELTAERFIKDPFSGDPPAGDSLASRSVTQGRLYKTGDLGRWGADGNIEYLGRNDHQVKIRGFRIELGEIEAQLRRQAQVNEAVVIARDEAHGDKRLVAYVTARASAVAKGELATGGESVSGRAEGLSVESLRALLTASLPDYMVPSAFVVLASLPLTANGKLDRKALPAPDRDVYPGQQYEAPRGEIESALAQIWQELLAVERVGRQDHFFKLGGHSLLAITLMTRIERAFQRQLPLSVLLESPTIEQLAIALGQPASGARPTGLVQIRAGGAEAPLFLLPGAGGNVVYFHPLARHLVTTRPIYALEPPGLDGSEPPLRSVEETAARHITNIWPVAGTGPYYLVGHSFGAAVALEMSRQLIAKGATVAKLAILDTFAPLFSDQDGHWRSWDDVDWLVAISHDVGTFLDTDLGLTRENLANRDPEDRLTYMVNRIKASGTSLAGVGTERLRAYLNVYQANFRASYIPSADPLPVSIAFYSSTGIDPRDRPPSGEFATLLNDPARGWGRFSQRPIEVAAVPGTHLTLLLEPHVGTLAAHLDAFLEKADR